LKKFHKEINADWLELALTILAGIGMSAIIPMLIIGNFAIVASLIDFA